MNARQSEGDERNTGDGVNPKVVKISNVALRERVYAELGHAIRSGNFSSGELVTIRGLAALLGTSTMPVREAVGRLVTERALEMLPNRTMRVPLLTPQRLAELTDVRVALEGRAAALASQSMTPAQFGEIRAANERYITAIEAGDLRTGVQANEAMHFAVYKSAGSQLILSMIEMLWLQSGPFIAEMMKAMANVQPGMLPEKGAAHHFELLAALTHGDAEAARQAIESDIRDAAGWYSATIFPHPSATAAVAAVAPISLKHQGLGTP